MLQDFPVLQSNVYENTEKHLQQWREKKPEKKKKYKTWENMKLGEHAFLEISLKDVDYCQKNIKIK